MCWTMAIGCFAVRVENEEKWFGRLCHEHCGVAQLRFLVKAKKLKDYFSTKFQSPVFDHRPDNSSSPLFLNSRARTILLKEQTPATGLLLTAFVVGLYYYTTTSRTSTAYNTSDKFLHLPNGNRWIYCFALYAYLVVVRSTSTSTHALIFGMMLLLTTSSSSCSCSSLLLLLVLLLLLLLSFLQN